MATEPLDAEATLEDARLLHDYFTGDGWEVFGQAGDAALPNGLSPAETAIAVMKAAQECAKLPQVQRALARHGLIL